MLRLRTLFNVKRTINNHFILWHELWIRDTSDRKLYICKALRYSAYDEHKNGVLTNLYKTNNIQTDEVNADVTSGMNYSDFQQSLEEDTSKESKSETKLCDNIVHMKHSNKYKDIQQIYPDPFSTVHNIYTIVQNELNQKAFDIITLQKLKGQWITSINILWPQHMEFTGAGRSKSISKTKAALKCLVWLHDNNRLKNGKPILYTKEETERLINAPVEIDISHQLIEKMQDLIMKYRMNIMNILENSDPEMNISFFDMKKGEGTFDTVPLWIKQERNKELKNRLMSRKSMKNHLPILNYRDEILNILENNRILLIVGDTGCGKTTQVPQFIIDHYTREENAASCKIGVSQPRRVSAISLAGRIAFERNEKVGDVVGYQVRLDSQLPTLPGQVCFYTTGILRQILQYNPYLNGYSHIIIDEAHERSIDTDILFLLLKRALEYNPVLKLIIMSATINADLFQSYFDCPIVKVPGKLYPVQQYFLEDFSDTVFGAAKPHCINEFNLPVVDYHSITKLITWIHENKPPGAILCFLPGWPEITEVRKLLEKNTRTNKSLFVLPIHSKMLNIDQRKIFESAPLNRRKVILATDIAETGITIADVAYVVDSAIKNDIRSNGERHCLQTHWISQANLDQRKGRAGRVQAGESYHFLTKKQHKSLLQYPVPEILTVSLEKTILDSKIFNYHEHAESFFASLIQPPSPHAVESAVNTLIKLGALDHEENLTPLGKRIAFLPVRPSLAKALVYASIFQCLHPVLSIVTMFECNRDIFTGTLNSKQNIRNIKQKFSICSDHLALLQIFLNWKKSKKNFQEEYFCSEMQLSSSTLRMINKLCKLHAVNLVESGMLSTEVGCEDRSSILNKYAKQYELICGIIYAATNHLLYHRNYCFRGGLLRKGHDFKDENGLYVTFKSESVNYKETDWPSPYLTYVEQLYNTKIRLTQIREASIITPLTVLLFSQFRVYIKENTIDETPISELDKEIVILCIEGMKNVTLTCKRETAETFIAFRHVVWSVVDYFIKHGVEIPGNGDDLLQVSYFKEELMKTILEIINTDTTYS